MGKMHIDGHGRIHTANDDGDTMSTPKTCKAGLLSACAPVTRLAAGGPMSQGPHLQLPQRWSAGYEASRTLPGYGRRASREGTGVTRTRRTHTTRHHVSWIEGRWGAENYDVDAPGSRSRISSFFFGFCLAGEDLPTVCARDPLRPARYPCSAGSLVRI